MMDMDFDASDVIADPRQEIISTITNEMSTIKRQMGELKAQIEQQTMMVNREQQNYSDIRAELQNIEHNLDTTPREDIRAKYEEALKSNTRLLTMRGQLEKFQAGYQDMEKHQVLLGQLLSKFQGVDFIEASLDDSEVASRSSANIIRIVQAQEDERQRLARQMHDGPAQSLTNFILQAEICQRLFDRNPERAGEELNNLKTTASITFQKVRDFIFDLRPMMLDDLGVIPTVRRYVASFKEKNDIAVELDITGDERRLESHREVLIFRAIQELMGHARDYANATQISITLDVGTVGAKRIRIVVEDNGRGFDPEVLQMQEEVQLDAREQGLVTLREKYELVDGSVKVESGETTGTKVRLELPSGE